MALFENVFAPYVPFGSRTLRMSTPALQGTDVAVLQVVYDLMLATMNPPLGPLGTLLPISGTYDAMTATAVRHVQAYFGLAVDGVVGPQTYFAFGQGVGPHTTYGGPAYGSRQLAQGSSGGDVTVLQNRLNTFRYAALVGHAGNGAFDAGTVTAVAAFKRDALAHGDVGFPPNAIAGFGFYDASWIYAFAGGRGIFTGRNGFDVAFLQALLAQLGLYAGPVTGYYDAASRSAVLAFQSASGIAADGVVGPQTFYHLGLRNAVPAPQPLGVPWPVTVTLTAVGSSGISGGAALYFSGPQSLTVSAAGSGLTAGTTYAMNIHFGTCVAGGPVGYALQALVGGTGGTAEATTTISGIQVVPPAGWFVTIELPSGTVGGTPTVVACGAVAPPFPLLAPGADLSFGAVTVSLAAVNGSTATGDAVLQFAAPQTLQVDVTVSGLPPNSTHPAHIHAGTCAAIPQGPIAYPLTNLVANGSGVATATTTITGIAVIPPVGWYINVHEGPTLEGAGATPIACGNVAPAGPVLPQVGP